MAYNPFLDAGDADHQAGGIAGAGVAADLQHVLAGVLRRPVCVGGWRHIQRGAVQRGAAIGRGAYRIRKQQLCTGGAHGARRRHGTGQQYQQMDVLQLALVAARQDGVEHDAARVVAELHAAQIGFADGGDLRAAVAARILAFGVAMPYIDLGAADGFTLVVAVSQLQRQRERNTGPALGDVAAQQWGAAHGEQCWAGNLHAAEHAAVIVQAGAG